MRWTIGISFDYSRVERSILPRPLEKRDGSLPLIWNKLNNRWN